MEVTFKGYTGYIVVSGNYIDGSWRIDVISPLEGPIATCTACVPGAISQIEGGQVLIKEYSENSGMVDALVSAGFIEPPSQWYEGYGFDGIPGDKASFAAPVAICCLTQKALDQHPALSILGPNEEQQVALKHYINQFGPSWKEQLLEDWQTGKDVQRPEGALLRQVRNNCGPEWLAVA